MRIRIATTAMLGLLSALVACNSSLGPGTATLSAGCYILQLGSRTPIPLQLIDEPLEDGTDKMLIQSLPGGELPEPYAWWTSTGDLVFSGLGPIRVSLTGDESPFRGRAKQSSDVVGVDPVYFSATLESIACPEWDKVPTAISIDGQSVELTADAFILPTDPWLQVSVSLPGHMTSLSVDRLWVLVGDNVWQTDVNRSPIPEYNLWGAVDSIKWDPKVSVEVVARLRDQSGNPFLVRDVAVPFAHGDPIEHTE